MKLRLPRPFRLAARDLSHVRVASFPTQAKGRVTAAQEHPLLVRVTHWLAAFSIIVLSMSGLQILHAFPSFGAKLPQHDFFDPPRWMRLGGWLGGALQWHFTFMWLYAACGVIYVSHGLWTRHYRTALFHPRDVPGVWPMASHYLLRTPEPQPLEPYNPLQKLAYSSALGLGAVSLLTGLVLYKPVQFHWLATLFGGFHLARLWHFLAMCGLWAFLPGHILMVVLHGWQNFVSMLHGWKPEPPYLSSKSPRAD
jgi:thiosulfate reductase cytochrome b subunit